MLKNILQHRDYKILISNFFSLVLLQGANFLLPLLAVPYLLRVIGVELYGLLAFASATIMYFSILSDYGFNLTATREVSVHRHSQSKLNEIFSAVMIVKFVFFLLGLIILFFLVFIVDKFHQHWLVYFITYGMVLGQVLFPVWFFQGMERMKYIALLNILAKILFLLAIFVFVHDPKDFYLVPLFNSFGFIVAGIISLYYINKEFHVSFVWQPWNVVYKYLKDGWHIFISRIAVMLYTSSNIFVLGLFTNNTTVGYYSIVEQIIAGVSSLGSMVNRVLFPYLSKVWSRDQSLYYIKFFKVLKIMTSMMLVIAIILFIFSPYIIKLLSGRYIEESVAILQILSITVILFPLGGLFTQSFVTQKENKYVTKVTLYTMIMNLLLVFILIKIYGVYGLAYTVLSVQLFHLFANLYYSQRIKRKHCC